MPIADCGPPILAQTPQGLQPVPRPDFLVRLGPTTAVEVGFDPGFFNQDPNQVQAAIAAASNVAPVSIVPALIDTGASDSCIDEELAVQLKLPLIDRQKGSGIGGTEEFNVYLGHIRIINLNFFQYGRFMGVRLKAGGQPHQVLLGRMAMRGMILIYNGHTGGVQLAV